MKDSRTKLIQNPNHMNDILATVARRAAPRKLDEYQQAIIAEIVDSCADLVTNHYKEIDTCRKDNKTASAVISMQFTLGWDNGSAKVNSVISFAKKYRDGREGIVGDPNQTKMFSNEGQAVVEEKKSKKGKK